MLDYPCRYDEKHKVWRSVDRQEMFNENISVGQVAHFMMRNKNPEDIMQISDSEGLSLTYGTALTAAIRLAQHFEKIGLTTEDVVSIYAGNASYVMPVAVAAWFNCTPFQPMNPVMETDVAAKIFDNIKPKIIFCDGLYYDKLKKASKAFQPAIYTLCNHVKNVPQIEELLKPTGTEQYYRPQPLTKGPNQTMTIMLTSGTTGLPKGICISNRYVCSDYGLYHSNERIFSAGSIDWLTGLMALMTNVLIGGVRVISDKPFNPEYFYEIIVKYKITCLFTNPFAMMNLSLLPCYSKESMASLRNIVMGGTPCPEKTLKRIRACLTNDCLHFCYGTSESGTITRNSRNYKMKSVGKLIPNLQLKIVDEDTGERLGPNQTGEVCILKDNSPWLGYYRNPESTKKSLDSEGFTHTGDMGYMDEDHYLHIVDRCKDVMKYRGYKYSPHQIESIVAEIPDVIEVCVFGVFDENNGHVPGAAVVKKPGSPLTEMDVIKHVESRSEVFFKHLDSGAFFLDKLPRNRNSKLMRDKIMEMCLNMNKEEIEENVDR